MQALVRNTREYRRFQDKKAFMERTKYLRDAGICANAIFLPDGTVGCPLHPAINGKDLREGHCDIKHLCKAAQEFAKWSKDKQTEFIVFIKNKNLDWCSYSIWMDNDKLLKEFLE